MNKITGLTDETPIEALGVVMDVVRGNPINKRKALVAALNVESYIGNQFLPEDAMTAPVKSMGAEVGEPLSDDEFLTLCESAKADLADDSGKMKAFGDGKWLKIAAFIVTNVLPLILAM